MTNNNKPVYHHVGFWGILTGVSNVLCPDGKRRYARVTAGPDTFFTIPASVKYQGKTVSGYITKQDQDTLFFPYIWTKNGKLFTDYYHNWLIRYGCVVARFPHPYGTKPEYLESVAEFWNSKDQAWGGLESATLYESEDDCPMFDGCQTMQRQHAKSYTLSHQRSIFLQRQAYYNQNK